MGTGLILLGRWAETPLVAWPGYCDVAQQTFHDRTGFRPEPFTLLREGLHEQYYVSATVEPMKSWFKSLPPSSQLDFSSQLYQAYYRDALELEQLTSSLAATNLAVSSAEDLEQWVLKWMRIPARLAGPIFFSVLLDIWYTSDEQSAIQGVIAIAAKARDHCANVYDIQAKREAERLFSEIAARLTTTWDRLQMLFPQEILSWLKGDSSIAEQIDTRQEFFVTENRNGKYSILTGDEAGARISEVILADLGQPQSHLEGFSAYGGSVAGKATRVLSTADVDKFNEGDVLVAYQTSVWYEPLFNRARAVLTELGGATSHAAVVCAERGIPCIVGIPNLVRSVTDGDHLIVDADNGSVDIQRSL